MDDDFQGLSPPCEWKFCTCFLFFILLACDFQTYWRNMNEWLRISNFWLLGVIPVVLKLFSSTFKLLYSLSKYLTKFLDFFSFSPWVVWRSVLDTKRFYWSCRIVSLVVGQANCLPYSIFRDPRAVCRGRTILTPAPPLPPRESKRLRPRPYESGQKKYTVPKMSKFVWIWS